MRIAIIAMGSRGDVQPYVALGKGLKAAGHIVRLLTHENFEGLVNSYELEFYRARGNVQEFVESPEMLALLEKGNFLAINAHSSKASQRIAIDWAKDSLAACQDMELLIVGVGGLFLSLALAEKFNLPLLQAYVFPFTPTRVFPAVLFPQSISKGGYVNRLSHHLFRQIMWQGSRTGDGLARKKVLDLPSAPFWGPLWGSALLGAARSRIRGWTKTYSSQTTHCPKTCFLDSHGDDRWVNASACSRFRSENSSRRRYC